MIFKEMLIIVGVQATEFQQFLLCNGFAILKDNRVPSESYCALVSGPIFFLQTLTAERYRNDIITLFNKLIEEEKTNGYFQQDRARAHTANSLLHYLSDVFQVRLISKRLWSPRSPD